MRIGISSWTYAWSLGVVGYPSPAAPMDALALLQKARDLDVRVLQIADNLPLQRLKKDEVEALAQRAKAWGIALEAGTRGVRPETLLPFLDLAKRLDATLVRTLLHDGDDRPSLAQAEQRLRAALPRLRELGLTLAVENHDLYPAGTLRGLIDRIEDPAIGVCLDPVNNLAQGESTHDVFRALGGRTVNFHCKDYTVRRKPSNLGFDVEGCATGDGLLNVPLCRERLEGRDLSYIVELWTPWQGDIEATCRLEREWAERSVAYLKG
ncbi:MAG TPA: TIM barrel protein, partial [Clostridia bacterium]|nr:TIM barrel protein [Clostridia bacterium]